MFKKFKKQVQQHFDKLAVDDLFYVTFDKDKIFEVYLNGFTSEEERQAHNCNCCKSFLRQWGGIVAIDPVTNERVSLWDFPNADELYESSRENLSAYIHSLPITDVFLNPFKKCGTDSNFDMIKNVTWNHFFLDLPRKFVVRETSSEQSTKRTTREMLKRNFNEITIDATETVLELIAQNSLYRGKESEHTLKDYWKAQKEYLSVPEEQKENYIWLQSVELHVSISRIRNTAMGTLLVDLSEGVDLEDAVGKFENMMSGTNYKRTTALVTPKMTANAKEKLKDLGLLEALNRRLATEADLDVNNVLFTDKSSNVKDVFGEIMEEQLVNPKNFSRTEEITMEEFIEKVVPTSKTIEILVENSHLNNLVSMVTAVDKESPSLFKWNNPFSWAYTGDIADSMKERVKSAGGKIDGVLRFSIQWNEDGKSIIDLDAHAHEPGGAHIYYSSPYRGDRHGFTSMGGQLDVDMINPSKIGVENITWGDKSKMKDGKYRFRIHNYSGHSRFSGYSAEIEFDGQIHEFSSDRSFTGYKDIASVVLKDGVFSLEDTVKDTNSGRVTSSKEKWNVKTNQFHKVDKMMLSPNYWDAASGNKHYFFMLKGCKADEPLRPFFNEFLKPEFTPNRKVFEIVGAKLKLEDSTQNQLSGIGFSETQRGHIIVRVEGKIKRTLKVNI